MAKKPERRQGREGRAEGRQVAGGRGPRREGRRPPRTRLPQKKAAEAGEKKPREPEERVTPRLRTQFDEDIRKR